MACAELVLPGDFDHGHHGGSGLGSDCAHTVSLYRQELEVVQRGFERFAWRGDWRVRCRVEACLETLLGRTAHRQECLCHLERCQAFDMAMLC